MKIFYRGHVAPPRHDRTSLRAIKAGPHSNLEQTLEFFAQAILIKKSRTLTFVKYTLLLDIYRAMFCFHRISLYPVQFVHSKIINREIIWPIITYVRYLKGNKEITLAV